MQIENYNGSIFLKFNDFLINHGISLTVATFFIMFVISVILIEYENIKLHRRSDFFEDLSSYLDLATFFTGITMITVPLLLIVVDFIVPVSILFLVLGAIIALAWLIRRSIRTLVENKKGY